MESPHQATAEEMFFNGDEKDAMVFYSRLMVEEPEREDLWLIQILYLIGQRQWIEAEAWISRALAQFTSGGPEWTALRQVMIASRGRAEEAWANLGRLEATHEGNWVVLLCGAAALARIKGRTQRAAVCVKAAEEAMPKGSLTFTLLAGGLLEACGNPVGALAFFRHAAKMRDDCAYALYRSAVVLTALERIAEARKDLLGAELLASENVRLRKKVALLRPKSRWERLKEDLLGGE